MANIQDNNPDFLADPPGVSSARFAPPRAGGRADKRQAITRAARTVFARDGYIRTSIDTIASEAGVSTRTVYNHFEGKEQLFSVVLHASATHVGDGFIADVERRLTGADPKGDLVALGHACAAMRTHFPEHFAMVRQIEVEAPHFPRATIDAWQRAGPLRVLHEIARRLGQLADRGLLSLDDPSRAAVHFSALATAGLTTYYGTPPPGDEDASHAVIAGVDAFLNGYAATLRTLPAGEQPVARNRGQSS